MSAVGDEWHGEDGMDLGLMLCELSHEQLMAAMEGYLASQAQLQAVAGAEGERGGS